MHIPYVKYVHTTPTLTILWPWPFGRQCFFIFRKTSIFSKTTWTQLFSTTYPLPTIHREQYMARSGVHLDKGSLAGNECICRHLAVSLAIKLLIVLIMYTKPFFVRNLLQWTRNIKSLLSFILQTDRLNSDIFKRKGLHQSWIKLTVIQQAKILFYAF